MTIEFTELAWEEFSFWVEHDPVIVNKIKELIQAIRKDPFKGIGKLEPLKFGLKGFWSRRISGEHRLVYQITGTKGINQKCSIIQCKLHYDV
ncbi:MAG TPA: Txe/YoeB family addiction module toxin [Flavobacteriales bacterium]|nr:Txe/YoeB family addiction module toxin [Flavobacteriales bacterium]HPH83135.1 Txe/YoeB family addiction module toxin [Flavobacteriales bacterium]